MIIVYNLYAVLYSKVRIEKNWSSDAYQENLLRYLLGTRAIDSPALQQANCKIRDRHVTMNFGDYKHGHDKAGF
jgi:hypothetical protein